MKIAVFADIHSNHIALEECLHYIEKSNIKTCVFLGDYISDFPYPQKTLELLKQISSYCECYFVKGNREEYMERCRRGEISFNKGSNGGSLLYTYENLCKEDFDWFLSLPIYRTVEIEGCEAFSVSHGGKNKSRLVINGFDIDKAATEQFIADQEYAFHAIGHSHVPFINKAYGKTLLNPGSVGVQTTGNTYSSMAVMEYKNGKWSAFHVGIPYDIEKAEKEFHESGLFEYANVWSRTIIANMKTGRHYNSWCLSLVAKISREKGVDFSDERTWQKAASILGI